MDTTMIERMMGSPSFSEYRVGDGAKHKGISSDVLHRQDVERDEIQKQINSP